VPCKDSTRSKPSRSTEKNKSKFGEDHSISLHQNWTKTTKDIQNSIENTRTLIQHCSQKLRYLLINQKSLKLTIDRVLPFWNDTIVPTIKSGKKVIIVAHGNSLRAIVKYLNNISNEGKFLYNKEIVELNIPTAIPLVYEFDENLKVLKHSYLADPEELEAQINKVKKQTAAK